MGEFLSRGIEAKDLIVDAVGEKDFAGFANDEIVEKMFPGIVQRVTAEEVAIRAEVNERCVAAIFGGVGPNCGVARIEADSENGQKMIAVCRNEIGSVAVRSDFNYFSLSQTAEIENFAILIPSESFGDEVFFFGE